MVSKRRKRRDAIMKKGNVFIAIAVAGVVAVATFLGAVGLAGAEEATRVITLSGQSIPATSIRIDPAVAMVEKGTVVVWANWVRSPDVEINFREGKKCDDATDSPVGFRIDANDCYVTTFVSMGETSSLKFSEVGTFEYTVMDTANPAVKAAGKIVVTEPKS
jgi:hypothetical protein